MLTSIDAEIWECDHGAVNRFHGDFRAYKASVLAALRAREAAAERAAAKLAAERAAKRAMRRRK